MQWTITYYSAAVQAEIDAWPVGIRAYYARITERIAQHGPNLGMPFTRQWVMVCLKSGPGGARESDGPFSARLPVNG